MQTDAIEWQLFKQLNSNADLLLLLENHLTVILIFYIISWLLLYGSFWLERATVLTYFLGFQETKWQLCKPLCIAFKKRKHSCSQITEPSLNNNLLYICQSAGVSILGNILVLCDPWNGLAIYLRLQWTPVICLDVWRPMWDIIFSSL